MDKLYTSNTEDKRLNIEEPNLIMGKHVLPQQIWRDGALIPGSPDDLTFSLPEIENNILVRYNYFKDGATSLPLVKKIERLPLEKVKGTDDTFYNKELVNLIGREFDNDPTDKKKSWQYILYSDTTELSYDAGSPIIDVASGCLRFRNKDFIKNITNETFYISFYKYIGRTGFLGSKNNNQDPYGGFDIPFRDDIKHFKDASNDNRTATLKVEGYDGNTIYVFPKSNMFFNDDNCEVDSYGALTVKNVNKGTVMLQENYQEIDWRIGKHNGGVWLEDGNVRKD